MPEVARAGSVQIGLLDPSKYDNWMCGEDVPLSPPSGELSCGSAKFGKCSDCPELAVRNRSNVPQKLKIKILGAGFAQPCGGGGHYAYGNVKCASGTRVSSGFGTDCGDLLAPGEGCTQPVEFCPQKAWESRGEVRVTVTAGTDKPHVEVFNLVGSGNYSPELAKADAARRSQLEELMKIPYVEKVELDTANHDLAINVEVTEDDKIEQVRRLVAPKIEGYRTEVTTYISVGCGL
ncbi:MAG: hypothetical protein ACREQR_00670 [Candidatus Binataceae bacterium]